MRLLKAHPLLCHDPPVLPLPSLSRLLLLLRRPSAAISLLHTFLPHLAIHPLLLLWRLLCAGHCQPIGMHSLLISAPVHVLAVLQRPLSVQCALSAQPNSALLLHHCAD